MNIFSVLTFIIIIVLIIAAAMYTINVGLHPQFSLFNFQPGSSIWKQNVAPIWPNRPRTGYSLTRPSTTNLSLNWGGISGSADTIHDFLEGKDIADINIAEIKPVNIAKLRSAKQEQFNNMLDDCVNTSIILLRAKSAANNLTQSVLRACHQGLIAAVSIIDRKQLSGVQFISKYNSADLRALADKIKVALAKPAEKIDQFGLILRHANLAISAAVDINNDCPTKLAECNADLNLLRANNERLREEVRRAIASGLTDHNCERLLAQCRAEYANLRRDYETLLRNQDFARNDLLAAKSAADSTRIASLQAEITRLHEIISAIQVAEASNPVNENLRTEIARLNKELFECKKFADELAAMM